MSFLKDLNAPLLSLTRNDAFDVKELVRGQHVIGSIAAGKSSTSSGFGGLAICTKPEEADLWRRYMEQAGRHECLCMPEED
jgi:hypothetical protein